LPAFDAQAHVGQSHRAGQLGRGPCLSNLLLKDPEFGFVSLRQGEQRFGLERALEMHVQLGLGQGGNKGRDVGHLALFSWDTFFGSVSTGRSMLLHAPKF